MQSAFSLLRSRREQAACEMEKEGCWVKWLEVKTHARSVWSGASRWVDGVRTAVEGVDPGEPGQTASTEGLHPLLPVTLLPFQISLFLPSSFSSVAAFRVPLFSYPYP